MKKKIVCLVIIFTMILGTIVYASDTDDSVEWTKIEGISRLDDNARSSIYPIGGIHNFNITYDGAVIANASSYIEFEVNDGNSARVLDYSHTPFYDDISGDMFTVTFSHSSSYSDGSGAYIQYYFTVQKVLLTYTYRYTIWCDIYGDLYGYGGLVQ